MLTTTTETVANKKIVAVLGIAYGSAVRSKNVVQDLLAFLKNLVGGEIQAYTTLQTRTREQALQRMIEDATRLGANAVVCVRMGTSSVSYGASEILAYGTAVTVE